MQKIFIQSDFQETRQTTVMDYICIISGGVSIDTGHHNCGSLSRSSLKVICIIHIWVHISSSLSEYLCYHPCLSTYVIIHMWVHMLSSLWKVAVYLYISLYLQAYICIGLCLSVIMSLYAQRIFMCASIVYVYVCMHTQGFGTYTNA